MNLDMFLTRGEIAQLEYEFLDFLKVLEFGARKHGDSNWLEPNGRKCSHKEMHASMFRHLADSSSGALEDHETGFDPLLHLAARAMMMYARRRRGIRHKDDLEETVKEYLRRSPYN